MSIDVIKNSSAYQDTASMARQNHSQQAASAPKIDHVDVSGTSVTQTVSAVFKEDGQKNTGNEDNGKRSAVSESLIRSAISEANYKATQTRCEFAVDKRTDLVSIKVIDKNTDKVIREIPAEETLDMIAKLMEVAGLLVDEKR